MIFNLPSNCRDLIWQHTRDARANKTGTLVKKRLKPSDLPARYLVQYGEKFGRSHVWRDAIEECEVIWCPKKTNDTNMWVGPCVGVHYGNRSKGYDEYTSDDDEDYVPQYDTYFGFHRGTYHRYKYVPNDGEHIMRLFYV